MKDSRQDEDTIRIDFLKEGDYKSFFEENPNISYHSLVTFFYRKSVTEQELGYSNTAKVCTLLMQVCTLVLNPTNKACPFERMIPYRKGNRASYGIHDFSEDEIHFLEEIWNKVEHSKLKARLADVIWCSGVKTNRTKRYSYAGFAATEYRKLSLSPEAWRHDGKACFMRLLSLIRIVEKKEVSMKEINSLSLKVLKEFLKAEDSPAFYIDDLLDVLDSLQGRQTFAFSVAEKLELLGNSKKSCSDWIRCQFLYEKASKWYSLAQKKDKSFAMRQAFAESVVSEAEVNNCLFAAEGLQKAIGIYLSLPTNPHNSQAIDKRISELRDKMRSRRQQIPSQLIHQEQKIDISKIVKNVTETISNQKPLQALNILANFASPPKVSDLFDKWQTGFYKSPFSILFGGSSYDEYFRKIHKSYGQSLVTDFTIDNPKVQDSMLLQYDLWTQYVAVSIVLPALDVLYVEHCFTEGDFLEFVRLSPIVPADRHEIIAKGLFAGYNSDFLSAMHILAPQVENIVRQALREYVETIHTDEEGIEDEKALGTLLDKKEAKEVMGEDLVYSLQAIFTLKAGPNIRNRIAHGLIDHRVCQSEAYIYAWWFVFRLIFKTFVDFTDCFHSENENIPEVIASMPPSKVGQD